MIRVRVPATSANLGPGFDAFGIALSLFNDFIFREKSDERLPKGYGLLGAGNLAENAVRLFASRGGFAMPQNLEIGIRARVPRSRGLGSSATLSVAGLAAANAWFKAGLGEEELLALAACLEGHPDNAAPAILGGFVISVKEGEQVRYLQTVPPKPLKVVAAVPEFELKTADSRKVLPKQVDFNDAIYNEARAGLLAGALITGRYELLRTAMLDRLHQPYRMPLVKGLEQVMAAALEAGALGACLSGSGPTVLVFCPADKKFFNGRSQADRISQAVCGAWLEAGVKSRCYHLDVAKKGYLLTE
ncbi:MAG: homoserine kinase [Peptococcaceae bacterium]|nr:homoserine kinase [Peptococcaceae bacterium]